MENACFISKNLIDWYESNKRYLPWRDTYNPYKIWVSEIILQQTRVIQGLDYYLRFIERFPDVKSLADADEQEVLKYWQGLGYYSRARNLHAAARTIRDNYMGTFPKDYESILKLKGIGEYTAAAITSFAWNLPHPVVDGNVFRFLSRLFMIDEPIDTQKGKKYFIELAGKIMGDSKPGLFNQAIMEFGALQCIPSSPNCQACLFSTNCLAYNRQVVSNYPVKQNKTKTKDLYLYYFHIHWETFTYIHIRKEKGIWQNLFEFPLIESEKIIKPEELIKNFIFPEFITTENINSFRFIIQNRKHVLSHRILYATFVEVFLKEEPAIPESVIRIREEDIEQYPVHRLMEYYIEKQINRTRENGIQENGLFPEL
ncbi:MAG: A/G-specific adenine glycosylase [Dysgonamonadaceae bacterium]|jgi:A/G-specific adenine glycosylase|nr:A/G-specific adenine glycosylase [Dysgonamonadaceae bacterium]